jgi:hypothetical protein
VTISPATRAAETFADKAAERWLAAVGMVDRARSSVWSTRALIHASRALLDCPRQALIFGGSDGEMTDSLPPLFHLGQAVRRLNESHIGVVVGILLRGTELVMVRWIDGATFESVGDLIEATQPFSRDKAGGAR